MKIKNRQDEEVRRRTRATTNRRIDVDVARRLDRDGLAYVLEHPAILFDSADAVRLEQPWARYKETGEWNAPGPDSGGLDRLLSAYRILNEIYRPIPAETSRETNLYTLPLSDGYSARSPGH
jgi:hypothetical protein